MRKYLAHGNDPSLLEVVLCFDRNLKLSPLHAAYLFSLMKTLPETIDRCIFEIQTRSRAHQQEVGALEDSRRSLGRPALALQQQRRLAFLGFAPSSQNA